MLATERAAIEQLTGALLRTVPIAGGSIASVQRLDAENGVFVLKAHASAPEKLFDSESACLAALSAAGVLTPEVLLVSDKFLLMRYIEPGPEDAAAAGSALARLHANTSSECGFFRDTYLATFSQPNAPAFSWADFYLGQRLLPMLERLQLEQTELDLWKAFGGRVHQQLNQVKQFSLLHGDLWPGNLLFGSAGPVFIDPACYYGDALIDIAMSQLFGGLGDGFYENYFSLSPRRENSDLLLQIYQVYPLLTHAVLFGSAYYAQAQSIRDNIVSGRI